MKQVDEIEQRREAKEIFDSLPLKTQPIVCRFLRLCLDGGFMNYYRAITAEKGLLPLAELAALMDNYSVSVGIGRRAEL